MMARISIAMDNAAFAVRPTRELARILLGLAMRVAFRGVHRDVLRDRDGGVVGWFSVHANDPERPHKT